MMPPPPPPLPPLLASKTKKIDSLDRPANRRTQKQTPSPTKTPIRHPPVSSIDVVQKKNPKAALFPHVLEEQQVKRIKNNEKQTPIIMTDRYGFRIAHPNAKSRLVMTQSHLCIFLAAAAVAAAHPLHTALSQPPCSTTGTNELEA